MYAIRSYYGPGTTSRIAARRWGGTEPRAAARPRITSYNVCYTKLLRLFARRPAFTRLGGYREWPLLEDVEFAKRLVGAGPVFELPLPLVTSARRWQRDGWFRRSGRNLAIVLCYS